MTHKIEIPEAFTPNYAQCFDDFDRKTERSYHAFELASMAKELTDADLLIYLAHGAPDDELSPDRKRRLYRFAADLLPKAPGRTRNDRRDEVICEAVQVRLDRGELPMDAYAKVADESNLSPERVRKIYAEANPRPVRDRDLSRDEKLELSEFAQPGDPRFEL